MRTCLTVAALAVALSIGACTKEEPENPYATPEDTVRVFATAMKAGDFESALDCYADEALTSKGVGVEGLSENEIRNLFLKSLEAAQGPYAKEELTNLQGRLLTAEVTYELGGTKHTHTLVNQNGEWKIATDLAH